MDISGCDEVTDLKRRIMALNIAEVQHILNFLMHHRDDLMIVYSLPYSWFHMDIPHFKLFKAWLIENNVIDMEELVKEVFDASKDTIKKLNSIPVSQFALQTVSETASDHSSDEAESSSSSGQ